MKIGILTYHRAENYGALLQAYALMHYLKVEGHDVSFVDYWPQYHSDYFKLFPWQQLKNNRKKNQIKFILKLILWSVPRYVRKRRFQRFMQTRLFLRKHPCYSDNDSTKEQYDLVIYGSDQIWREQKLGGVGFDDWYFGSENVRSRRKIVYGGSMGAVIDPHQYDCYFKRMMKNFCSISVRELDLQNYLNEIGISSTNVIDPVFLISKNEWEQLYKKSTKSNKCILFYNLLNTPESKAFAERLSKEKKLPVRELNKQMSFSHIGKRYIFTASVEQFLQLIGSAEYVVSNSFHGVAMSIIFQKQFFAVGMGHRANRVKSLLSNLNISERYVEDAYVEVLNKSIDYNIINLRLQEIIEESKSYLKESIR